MPESADHPELIEPQRAALAKLSCAVESPGISLLCGPPGVGKTTVLHRLAAATGCVAGVRRFADCEALVDATTDIPTLLLVDDADGAHTDGLDRLVTVCRRRRPDARIVLTGAGRLLTLVSRDPRIEQAVRLRATLRPCSAAESAVLASAVLGNGSRAARLAPLAADVAQTIHEIAAGIPATVVRLANLAQVLAELHPERPLTVADIEMIHRRLSLQAA